MSPLLFKFENPVLIQEAYLQMTFLLEFMKSFQTNFKHKESKSALLNTELGNYASPSIH